MIVAPPRTDKPPRRAALERPYQVAHERSASKRMHQPQTLRDLVRECRAAWDAHYAIERLHRSGVEWEKAGGSALGTPRWTEAFRRFVTSADCDVVDDSGEWRVPMRSALFRMSISSSNRDGLAARFAFLLHTHRFNVREAWAVQCGPLADPAIACVAEVWARDALWRWWGYYIQKPEGKRLRE